MDSAIAENTSTLDFIDDYIKVDGSPTFGDDQENLFEAASNKREQEKVEAKRQTKKEQAKKPVEVETIEATYVDDNGSEADTNRFDEDSSNQSGSGAVPSIVVERLFDTVGIVFDRNVPEFKSIDELGEYIRETFEEDKPNVFANDDVASINEYVANGGSLRDIFEQIFNTSSVNGMNDVELVAASLKAEGRSQDYINRRVQKLVDQGLIEDEAANVRDEYEANEQYRKEQFKKEQADYRANQLTELKQARMKIYNDIKTTPDILTGNALSSSQADTLYQIAFSEDDEGVNGIGRILNNNKKLSIIMQLENIDWDLDKLKRYTKSDANKELFKLVTNVSKKQISKDTSQRNEAPKKKDVLSWYDEAIQAEKTVQAYQRLNSQ